MSVKSDLRPQSLARFVPLEFASQCAAVSSAEFKKLIRDPTEIISRAVQPVLWLAVFGQVFARVKGIPTGAIDYQAYITPGILAQSVLFSAIFYGIAVIWERDLGIVHKLLVSPANRGALIVGKALSAGFRGVIQTAIVYGVAIVLGIPLRWQIAPMLGVLTAVVLGSALFSTFSLIIACLVKTRERFMGIGQVLTMPLFFASSAIYPLELMPSWLQVVAKANPLSYLVEVLRSMMLEGTQPLHSVGFDFGVLIFAFLALAFCAAKLYPTLIQ